MERRKWGLVEVGSGCMTSQEQRENERVESKSASGVFRCRIGENFLVALDVASAACR